MTKANKRVVFVNRRSMVTLAVVTVALLAVLKPNRAILIDMLEDAEDPTIALAFLNVLQDPDEPSLQLDYLTAQQHFKLNAFNKVDKILMPIERFQGSRLQQQAFYLYGASLLQQISADSKNDSVLAKRRLHDFLREQASSFVPEELETFGGFALQSGAPGLAYNLKKRSNKNTPSELLMLARQAGFTEQAYEHALTAYEQDPSSEHLRLVLMLSQELAFWQRGFDIASSYFNKYVDSHAGAVSSKRCDRSCLQLIIDFARAADRPVFLAQVAIYKARKSSQLQDWIQASQSSSAINNLADASYWLEKVMTVDPQTDYKRRLVSLYLWQENTEEALKQINSLISEQSNASDLRLAIQIARAESNVTALSKFLYLLAKRGFANLQELREWLSYSERVYSPRYMAERLNELLQQGQFNEQNDEAKLLLLEAELGRFYNYLGEQNLTANLWESRLDYREKRLKNGFSYSFNVLNHFIQAFVDINKPEQALKLAKKYLALPALTVEEIDVLQRLASFVGDREGLRVFQQAKIDRQVTNLDPYLLVATHNSENARDRRTLWLYYFQYRKDTKSELPDVKALVILSALLRGAIAREDVKEVARVRQQLGEIDSWYNEQAAQLLLQIASFEGDSKRSKQLLTQLLENKPGTPRYQRDAIWLAIAEGDESWLTTLYHSLVQHYSGDPQFFQVFANAAQVLGLYSQSLYWYDQLQVAGNINLADLLSWSQLLHRQGQMERARQLRWRLITEASESIQSLPEGKVSYRSLLDIFVGSAYASAKLTKSLSETASLSDVESILLSQGSNSLQRIAYWQAIRVLSDNDLSETVQLALALAKGDENKIQTLAYSGRSLTAFERASALLEIGEHAAAWKIGEEALNAATSVHQLAPLQRFLAAQHEHRSHGVKMDLLSSPSWGMSGAELTYYRPVRDSQISVGIKTRSAIKEDILNNRYNYQELNFLWEDPNLRLPNTVGIEGEANYRITAFKRFSERQLGYQFEWLGIAAPRFNYQFRVKWNQPATQSESLSLFATEDAVELTTTWQAATRTGLAMTIRGQKFSTDFDDSIGVSRQVALRVNETLQRSPNWQAYMQYDYHQNQLETGPLQNLQGRVDTAREVTPTQFLAPKYHRFAIGQQVTHGSVGEAGPDVKGMRYRLDTSLGYNFVARQIEFGVNFDIGIRVLGGDELYLSSRWQSGDINGQTSTSVQLGYFFDF